MKQDMWNDIKLESANVVQMQVLVIINNIETKVNVDVNVKNWLTKEHMIMDLFGIVVTVNVSVVNRVISGNIWIIKNVYA